MIHAENLQTGGALFRFTLKDLTIDYDARQIYIQGNEIKLTQTEYNIVALLSENAGKRMTYAAIIKAIWGYPDEGSVKSCRSTWPISAKSWA